MADYIPFPAFAEFAPLDISFLFEDEKPAGKHGFLRTEGDNFVFEDGTTARFWGTNLNGGACFPDKDYAPKLAKRLASYGCNMVRLHQLDSEANLPNVYQFRRGRHVGDTSKYDAESLDHLDYLIYCLKNEGIYVFLDMMVSRTFHTADGVQNPDLPKRAAPFCIFDPRMIELQKGYMDMLWNHVNPYTGLAYKEEPAVALTDVVNEQDLMKTYGRIELEPYASQFRERFRAWCVQRGIAIDVDAVDLNDNTVEALTDFKTEIEQDYYDSMMAYMRSIGVRIPITGCNFSARYLQCRASTKSGDFIDTHLNIRFMNWGPEGRYWQDISLHELPEWGAMRTARKRTFGRPLFTSEWDLTWPNKFRAESAILVSAVGRLQNWSGYTIHTYAYTSLIRHMDILGKEVSAATISDTGYREGPFATWNDPAKFGMFYHGALITRRGDVKPSDNKVVIGIRDMTDDGVPNSLFGTMAKKALIASTELCQIGADYEGKEPDAVSEFEPLVDLAAGEVRSDTGELYRSWEKKYGTVDTPMTQCVYGRLAQNGKVELTDLTVECENDYAVIALSSLNNDSDIAHSDCILLTAVGNAVNTDMQIADDVPEELQPKSVAHGMPRYRRLSDFGHAPILCEVINAEIAIRIGRKMRVRSISAEGLEIGNIPVELEDGWLKFRIGGSLVPSIYYLIEEL